MPEIKPFRGVRFNIARAGNPAALMSMVPDQLDEEQRQRLRDRSEFNILHVLDPPIDDGDSDASQRYVRSGELFRRWLNEGRLHVDSETSLYVYEHTYGSDTGRTVRRGFLALLRLDPGSGKVLLPGRPESRTASLASLRATNANLEPVLALYDDPKGEIDGLLTAARSALPDLALTDEMGIEHRLFPVSSPYDLRRVVDLMRDKTVTIGHGGGIYEAARLYQVIERAKTPIGSSADQPYNYVLASFTNRVDPGLSVLPYHRVIQGVEGFEFGPFLRSMGEWFEIEQLRSLRDQVGMMRKLQDACNGGHAMVILGGGAVGRRAGYVARLKDSAADRLAEVPYSKALKALDVTVLNTLVLEDLLGMTVSFERSTPGIHYTPQLSDATQMGRAKTTQLVVLLNPPSLEAIDRVSEAGDHLPYRTVHFFPPVIAGLAMHDLAVARSALSD